MVDESSKDNGNLEFINLYELDLSGLKVLSLAIPRTPCYNFGSSMEGCGPLKKKNVTMEYLDIIGLVV